MVRVGRGISINAPHLYTSHDPCPGKQMKHGVNLKSQREKTGGAGGL